MIVLFTDFGLAGPYIGQVKAVLHREAPGTPVIDLFADLPPFQARPAAYLLAAYAEEFPRGTVFLCVVDPGVGSARAPAAVLADGRWYVGPDNGLFELVMRRATTPAAWWRITFRPERLSATFHGRDLFAPIAARLARGDSVAGVRADALAGRYPNWPDDLTEVVYIDHFGNAITGCRAATVPAGVTILTRDHKIAAANTFSAVQDGAFFWYENANGLVEIAVNKGRADRVLGLSVGSSFIIDANVNDDTAREPSKGVVG